MSETAVQSASGPSRYDESVRPAPPVLATIESINIALDTLSKHGVVLHERLSAVLAPDEPVPVSEMDKRAVIGRSDLAASLESVRDRIEVANTGLARLLSRIEV